jgi:hypothetical protein
MHFLRTGATTTACGWPRGCCGGWCATPVPLHVRQQCGLREAVRRHGRGRVGCECLGAVGTDAVRRAAQRCRLPRHRQFFQHAHRRGAFRGLPGHRAALCLGIDLRFEAMAASGGAGVGLPARRLCPVRDRGTRRRHRSERGSRHPGRGHLVDAAARRAPSGALRGAGGARAGHGGGDDHWCVRRVLAAADRADQHRRGHPSGPLVGDPGPARWRVDHLAVRSGAGPAAGRQPGQSVARTGRQLSVHR